MKQLSLLLLLLLILSCTQEKPKKELPVTDKEYNYKASISVHTLPPLFTKSELDSLLAVVTGLTSTVEEESKQRYTVTFLAMDSTVATKASDFQQTLKEYQTTQTESLKKSLTLITVVKDSLHHIVTELEQEHYNLQILSGFNPEPTGLDLLLRKEDSLYKSIIHKEDSLIALSTQSQQWIICNDSMLFFSHKSNHSEIISSSKVKDTHPENKPDSTTDSLSQSMEK